MLEARSAAILAAPQVLSLVVILGRRSVAPLQEINMAFRGIISEYDEPSMADRFGDAILNAGQAAGTGIQQYFQMQKQEQEKEKTADIVSQLTGLDKETLKGIDPQHYKELLRYGGERGLKQLQEKGVLQESARKKDELRGLFQKFGMSDKEADRNADLYSQLTTGGQTEFAGALIDKLLRQDGGFSDEPLDSESMQDEMAPLNTKKQTIRSLRQNDPFKGRTPKEKIALQKEFQKDNKEIFKEVSEKSNAMRRESRSLDQLKRLNDSGELPEGLGRFNVNPTTGKLFVPAGANEKTQLYTKIVNDFVSQAKDTFGARVSNFELETFLQRLPTLANTKDGRKLILDQMSLVNQLNSLYNDSLKDVYNTFGLRGIDHQQAEEIAQSLRQEEEDRLLEEYARIPDLLDIHEEKAASRPGEVLVENFEGKRYHAPKERVDELLQSGWRIVP